MDLLRTKYTCELFPLTVEVSEEAIAASDTGGRLTPSRLSAICTVSAPGLNRLFVKPEHNSKL